MNEGGKEVTVSFHFLRRHSGPKYPYDVRMNFIFTKSECADGNLMEGNSLLNIRRVIVGEAYDFLNAG